MRPVTTRGGGRAFLPTKTYSTYLAIGIVVGSLVAGLAGAYADYLVLLPSYFFRGFVYQPLTYLFVERDPMSVLFGALIMWQTGSALEMSWGPKRFLTFALVVGALSGVLAAVTVQLLHLPGGWTGAWVMGGAVWCAFGWSWGSRQTNFWGLPVSGNWLAGIGILMVLLEAVLVSWLMVIPRAFAIGLTFLYVRYGSPATWLTRFRGAQLQRRLRGRNKLRVVTGESNEVQPKKDYLN